MSFTLDQFNYIIKTIEPIKIENHRKQNKNDLLASTEINDLQSLIGQLNWVSGQTRPDISFDLCDMSSGIKKATVKDLLRINKIVTKVNDNAVSIKLGLSGNIHQFQLAGYNDASFGNLNNGGSQGGFIIYLVNEKGHCSPLMWQSSRLKRVVKSAMAAETLIQVECAEACFWLGKLFNEIIYTKPDTKMIPTINCYTDSNQLYEAALSLRPIKDFRLRTEMGVIREMLERKEIHKIHWTDSSNQLADSLTKTGASSEKLLKTFKTKTLPN